MYCTGINNLSPFTLHANTTMEQLLPKYLEPFPSNDPTYYNASVDTNPHVNVEIVVSTEIFYRSNHA